MRELSINQFKTLCNEYKHAEYIFDSKNQTNGDLYDVKMSANYEEVLTMLSPERICFKNRYGFICFDRVKSILYDDENPDICPSFHIICGSLKDHKEDSTHVIMIRKH